MPVIWKIAILGVVGFLAFRKKGDEQTTGPVEFIAPTIGQRWTYPRTAFQYVPSSSTLDHRYWGWYRSSDGKLIAVIDSHTIDDGDTSAIVVKRSVAPDLTDNLGDRK